MASPTPATAPAPSATGTGTIQPNATLVDNSQPSALMSAAPLILVFFVMYFLLIRPQQKKLREHTSMTDALRRGDKIVTAGGVIGTIHKLEGDDIIVVEIAPEIRVRVMRDTVSVVLNKTVANDNKADEKSK